MALNPDRPVAAGDPDSPDVRNPQPANQQEPVNIDFDRMVDDIHAEVRDKNWRSLAAREDEARARLLGQNTDERSLTPGILRSPIRGIVKGVTRAAEFFNVDLAQFPSFGLARRASSTIDEHAFAHGRERGARGAHEFFDLCARYETFKLMKRLRREEGRAPTRAELEIIQKNIVNEQPYAAAEHTREPFDVEEVTRQERIRERFGDALHRGNYTEATRIYRNVLEHISSGGLVIEARRRWQLEEALTRNENLPKGFRETPEAIAQRIVPEGMTENRLRNELLQKYLRILASQHIVDMIEGHIPVQLSQRAEHRFVGMVRDLSAMTELTRDDIPTDDAKIQSFFESMKQEITHDIATASQSIADGRSTPIVNRVYTALRLGILTPVEINAIDPNIDSYLTQEGARAEPTTGERIRMAVGDMAGALGGRLQETPEQRQLREERETREQLTRAGARERAFLYEAGTHLDQTPENRTHATRSLVDAWRRDIANDNDKYSNFDGARARIIERHDVLPRTAYTYKYKSTNQHGKEAWLTGMVEGTVLDADIAEARTAKDNEIERLKKEIVSLQKEQPQNYQEDVRFLRERIASLEKKYRFDVLRMKEHALASRALLQPDEIEREIMTEEFRTAIKGRLIEAFRRDLGKYRRQLDAVSRVRDETYAPYRILDDKDIREVIDTIRESHAQERLVEAARRGTPMLFQEEDAMVRYHIFTQEELDQLRPEIERRARE